MQGNSILRIVAHTAVMTGKERWDDGMDYLEDFFEGEGAYDLVATHQTRPGTALFTVEDTRYGETGTVLWAGERDFAYATEEREEPLSKEHELYDVAAHTMDLYERGLAFDSALRLRARTEAMGNSPEAMRALNNPMEWGVETGNRSWSDRDTTLLGRLLGALRD